MSRSRICSTLALVVLFCAILLWPRFSVHGQNTPHSINLTWTAEPAATGGFNVYRSTSATGPFSKYATVIAGVSTFSDTNATAGTQYFYVVTALDTATPPDESAQSNIASATALGNPPSPSGLAAVSK